MNELIFIALGFSAHLLLLGLMVTSWRAIEVLRGKKKSNEYLSGTPHGAELYWRINRAQANAAENIMLPLSVIFAALYLNYQSQFFVICAIVYLVARVLQSIVHISANTVVIVNIRFSFLMLQYLCFALMAAQLVQYILQ